MLTSPELLQVVQLHGPRQVDGPPTSACQLVAAACRAFRAAFIPAGSFVTGGERVQVPAALMAFDKPDAGISVRLLVAR